MFMYSCIKSSIGTQGGWPAVKVLQNPTEVYSTSRSQAVVPALGLLFIALWFIVRGDLF